MTLRQKQIVLQHLMLDLRMIYPTWTLTYIWDKDCLVIMNKGKETLEDVANLLHDSPYFTVYVLDSFNVLVEINKNDD